MIDPIERNYERQVNDSLSERATLEGAGKPYTYQALYEKRAKSLAGLIVSGHVPSIDKIARLLAKEDAGR